MKLCVSRVVAEYGLNWYRYVELILYSILVVDCCRLCNENEGLMTQMEVENVVDCFGEQDDFSIDSCVHENKDR